MEKKELTIQEIIDGAECPFPINVIPDMMGINLCSVSMIGFVKQDDGQLQEVIIRFTPNGETKVKPIFLDERLKKIKTIVENTPSPDDGYCDEDVKAMSEALDEVLSIVNSYVS